MIRPRPNADPGLAEAVRDELQRRGGAPEAARIWSLALEVADTRTGEIRLTRERMAARAGMTPERVSGVLDTLRVMKALWLRPGWRRGPARYFLNPAIAGGKGARPRLPADAQRSLAVALDDWPHCPY